MPPIQNKQWWRPRYWLLVLCALNALISYADRTNISIAIIEMAREFQWSQSTSGFVLSTFYYGYLCTQLVGGWLSYRYGGKIVLALSCFLWSLFTVLTPFCARLSFPLLIACRVCLGLAEGMGYPSIMAMIAVHIPSNEHSRAIGFVLSGSYVGAVLSNLCSAQLIERRVWGGWPSVFIVFGIGGILWLVPWLLYTAPPLAGGDHHLLATSSAVSAHESVKLGSCNTTTTTTTATTTTTKNNYNAGITAYQRLPAKLDPDGSEDLPLRDTAAAEVIEIEDDTDEFPSTPSKPTPDITAMRETSNGKVPWGKLFQTRQLWAIIITQFCQSWSYWLFLNWMPTYYKDVFGADIEEIGYFTVVPYVVQGITGNLVGLLSDILIYRYNYSVLTVRRFMQCTGMLLMALFTLLAAIAVSSITQGMIFITLAMGVFNMTLAGVSVNHLDIAPQYASVVYGIGNTAAQIPGIIGVWFTGVLLDWTHGNWTVVFGLAASLSALGAVCWFLMVGTRPVV